MGLFGALLASVAYGAGTIAQAVGVQRAQAARGSWLKKAAAGWLFAVGLGFDGLGYVASFAALRDLPLFLVESTIASSVAVTAVLSVVLLKQTLRRAEVAALGAIVGGLVMLSLSAEPGAAKGVPTWVGLLLLGAVALCGLALVAAKRPVVLAFVSGCGFSVVGLASRLLEIPAHDAWRALEQPMAWALLAGGLVAVVGYGLALDRGSATTVAAVSFSVETILPSVVGLVFLGDHIRPGMTWVAAAGFAVTLLGCLVLASRAEVAVGSDATAGSPATIG